MNPVLLVLALSLSPSASVPSGGNDQVSVPLMLSYQGKLTDVSGQPVPDSGYTVVFKMYHEPSGGAAFWTETQAIMTDDGLFSTLLGRVSPIESLPASGNCYLEMTVDPYPPMRDRIEIVSAAYSYYAQKAESANYAVNAPPVDSARVAATSHRLQGKDTSAFVRSGQPNAVANVMLQGDAVTSDKVMDHSLTRNDVSLSFKSPFADTSDYARAAPGSSDSARVAANAHRLQNKDTSDLDARYVNEGQVSSLTSAMIVDGAIAAADLSQMGASTGQVVKWTGSAWAPANDSVGTGGSGTVRNVVQATGVVCSPNPITDSGTVRFDSTWGDARFINEGQANSVTGAMIVDGAVSSSDIRDTTVNTADLKDAAVTMAKINQAGATSGQVIKWTGSAWAPGNDSVGNGGIGTVRKVVQATGVACSPNPITDSGTVGFDQTYGDGRYINDGEAAAGDLSGTYPSPQIASSVIVNADISSSAGISQSKISNSARAIDADKVDGYDAGNSSGQVALSNSTVCTNLNADRVDSKHASDFVDLVSTQSIGGSKSFTASVSVSGSVNATGFGVSNAGDNNAVNVTNNSSSYPTIWARNSSTGNCISARNTGTSYPAVFAKAEGNGVGVWCEGDNGVYAVATRSGSYPAGYFYAYNGDNSNLAIYAVGRIYSTGYLAALPETDDQAPGFAVVSPEVEVNVSGSARLSDGQARVSFDNRLSAAISPDIPVRVIVTPTEQCKGVYVATKSRTAFTVRELDDGRSSASFDWLLIGRKLGCEKTPTVTRPPDPGSKGSSQ